MTTVKSISELEAKIKLLEEENQRLKENEFSHLSTFPEIVFVLNGGRKLTFVNDVCLEKFELTKEDLIKGIYLQDIIAPESIEDLQKIKKDLLLNNEFSAIELVAVKKNGERFLMSVFGTKLKKGNKTTGFKGIGFDITGHKEIEQKLQEANLAKVKFFSIIAHDLKNPFNSLVGFSQLLLNNYEKYSAEKVKEYILYINRAAHQGFSLLDNLLEWSRAQTGKLEVVSANFDLNEIINDASKLLAGNVTKKEIALTFDCESTVKVHADRNMIFTVVRNLISNAIKFTHRQGHIHLYTYKEKHYGVVEVIDNGIGIKPESLEKLFNIDNEFSALGTEKETGTGLGLILCQEFITLNKGIIEVESKVGEGSTFRVKLPLISN